VASHGRVLAELGCVPQAAGHGCDIYPALEKGKTIDAAEWVGP